MENRNSKGIVLLGHPRSGTTLTRRLLNGHSRIASPPETHLLSACGRFLESEKTHAGLDIGALSGLNFAGINDEAVLTKLREFAFSFLDDFAAREGKQRWAEKTAFDAFHIHNIEHFIGEHALFVGIVRHPLDVAMSCIKFCDSMGFYPKDMHKYIVQYPHPIEAFAHSWLEVTKDLISLNERHPKHCKIYRYEDIVASTESTLTELLNFVGEEFEPKMLEQGLSSEQSVGFGDHKSYQAKQVHNDSVGKWNSIPQYQIQKLAPVLNPMLERLGYPVIEVQQEITVAQAREQYSSSMKIVAQLGNKSAQPVAEQTVGASQLEGKQVDEPKQALAPRMSIYGYATTKRSTTFSVQEYALEPNIVTQLFAQEHSPTDCVNSVLLSLLKRIGEDNHLEIGTCTTEQTNRIITPITMPATDATFTDLLQLCHRARGDNSQQCHGITNIGFDVVSETFTENAVFNQALSELSTKQVAQELDKPSAALVLLVLVDKDTNAIKLAFHFNDAVWLTEQHKNRTVAHFKIILNALLEDNSQSIEGYSLLTTDEQSLLINAQTFDQFPRSVIEQFIHQVRDRSSHTALVCGEQVLTYQELGRRVLLLSSLLKSHGVEQGQLVAVCLDRSSNLVVALLAVMHAGATYVPLDPDHPQSRISQILEDAQPSFILSEQHLLSKLGDESVSKTHTLTDALWESHTDDELEFEQLAELAYIIFTSGSTGRPKGVEVYQHGLSTFLAAMAERPGMNKEDRLLSVTTVSFDIAALEIFLPLTLGATLYLAKREDTMNGVVLQQLMADHQITFFQATPATYHILLANDWPGSADIKLLCGGEAMPPELAEQLLSRCHSLWNMYGPTETTIWSTVKQVEQARALMPIGTPIRGTRTYVLNDKFAQVPLGVAGELFIAGEGVAKGYHHRDEQTKERFLTDAYANNDSAKMYRTGDLVKMLDDGDLVYLGRLDNQVKIRGYRIELGDIEAAIKARDDIKQCVVGVYDLNPRSKSLVAYLIAEDGNKIDIVGLKEYLKPLLPEYMIPSFVVHLDEFPLTPNNKVDRKALPDPRQHANQVSVEVSATAGSQPVNQVTGNEDASQVIIRGWQRILGIHDIRQEDSFVGLGGDSLSFVQITIELEKVIGQLPDGWENKSIQELSGIKEGVNAELKANTSSNDIASSKELARSNQESGSEQQSKLASIAAHIDTTIFVRAFAMLSVVFIHTFPNWGIKGNTSVLFMVAGLLFAKFQLQQVFSTGKVKPVLMSAWRIVLPSTLIMGAWLWVNDIAMLDTLLLYTNLTGTHITNFGYYWYIQVLVQLLLILVILFSIEPVLNFAKSEPFKFGLVMLAVSLVAFLMLLGLLPSDFNVHRLPALPMWYFAIGWCIYFADTSFKRVVIGHILAFFAVVYFFLLYRAELSLAQPLLIMVFGLLLITQAKIVVLKPINTLCYMLASSSLFVYLVHMPIIQNLPKFISIHGTVDKFIAVGASLVVGYLCWRAWEFLLQCFSKKNKFTEKE